ncbi:Oidioi.mRNA.OKI2018_I69.chr2.g7223.t1.cds [Oikopleura dioica]|uniref:Oidioi.mRNA.OKI2018_I69.chr2.g7223.t1.cds n=1 Tax=Oikopleura dioica TaxID=34765 RepID=A0ABN7T5G9_OIKDI|nr:Oidioi.mRNA.OKI2018_I69.chr2.g7223.t1.cds [Oikopleura dioica]
MGMGLPKHCYNVTVYESQMSVPVDESVLYIATVILLLMLLFSVVGNIITLMAITFGDRMQNKANCFIFSLAMSDLLSALVSPVGIYIRTFGFNPYRWPHPLCNVYWAIEESTSFTTSIHIASFAVFRYVSVCLSRAQTLLDRRWVIIYLMTLWTISLTCGIYISSNYLGVKTETSGECWPQCSLLDIPGADTLKMMRTYQMATYPIFYYLPFLVLVLSSCFIGKQLIQSSRRSKNWRKNRQAVVQLALVVISFFIGYLPNILYFLTTEHGKKDGYHVDYWMNLLCYVCLRLSECMNPFLYNVASTKMRRSSHSRRVKNFDVRQSHSDPSIFSSVNDNRSLTPNDEPNKRPSSARHHLGLHETGSDDIPFSRTKDLQTHSKSCRARKSSRACENGYGSLMPAPTVLSNRTCHTLAPLHIHRGRSHCPNCQNNLVPSSSNESLN